MKALDPIFKPRSIAVIGASRSANTIGHQVLANLIRYGYNGSVYPVNPYATSIRSIRAYPTIASVPESVDLAVITVPKDYVVDVAEECGEAGVNGLVVITAGFKEVGGAGLELERRLVEIVEHFDMRMIGPNCMGVLNTDPAVAMNATFAPVMPPVGTTAVVSQSGALGLSVLDYAKEYGIGISQFASIGNKSNVSGNDLLLQWEDDPTVSVILMYVENFGNPHRFLDIASRITRKKPIIVLKSGRSKIGASAAASHTGALAASDLAVDALLSQAGVMRAQSIEELFDMAMAFGVSTLPRSRKTVVLTNSGGPGILLADAFEANGVEMAELSTSTVDKLKKVLPAEASLRNPLDMIASATPANYRTVLETLLDDPNIDAAVSVFVPPLGVKQKDVAEAIVAAASTSKAKPVIAVLMGREGLPQGKAELGEAQVPAYVFPESAARGLAGLNRHAEWIARVQVRDDALDVNSGVARNIVASALEAGHDRLNELEALEILKAYGIAVAPACMARSADDAARIATRVGYPVAMKIVSNQIMHKTDVGGVRVGLIHDDDVRAAFHDITLNAARAVPDAHIDGVLVQKMVKGGRELIAGATRDPLFGPLVMFGLGGIYAEALRDVVFRLAPITSSDARDMIDGIRAQKMLEGLRGEPPVNRAALVDVLRRVSMLASDVPEIGELDLNPILACGDGVVAVDARVTLGTFSRTLP